MKRSRLFLHFSFSFSFRDPRTRDAIVSVKPFPQIKKTATLATKGYERAIWRDLLTTGRTARFSPLHAHHTEGTEVLVLLYSSDKIVFVSLGDSNGNNVAGPGLLADSVIQVNNPIDIRSLSR